MASLTRIASRMSYICLVSIVIPYCSLLVKCINMLITGVLCWLVSLACAPVVDRHFFSLQLQHSQLITLNLVLRSSPVLWRYLPASSSLLHNLTPPQSPGLPGSVGDHHVVAGFRRALQRILLGSICSADSAREAATPFRNSRSNLRASADDQRLDGNGESALLETTNNESYHPRSFVIYRF